MNGITFSYDESGIELNILQSVVDSIKSHKVHMKSERERGYDSAYASLSAPNDSEVLKNIIAMVKKKQELAPTVLIIIGIGGSNLGSMAVLQATFGLFYNEQQPTTRVYFADTVDSDYSNDILLLMNQELERGGIVMLNVISKSGTTTETNLNFQCYAQALESYYGQAYRSYIIVTSDAGSRYETIAQEYGYDFLAIPQKVGGRYSVLTSVGLFPLGMIGVDIEALSAGAADCIDAEFNASDAQGPSLHAALTYAWYQRGISIDNQFIFSADLHAIGLWYRQLVAESLGKRKQVDGQEKHVGILPLVSMGTVDLHSMVQLYLAGQLNIFTTFVSVAKEKSTLMLQDNQLGRTINGKLSSLSFNQVMKAILEGTCAAYAQEQLPYCHITLANKSEHIIGQFLQWNMLRVMYLGALLQVDPFDQPQVELYKTQTRRILSNE